MKFKTYLDMYGIARRVVAKIVAPKLSNEGVFHSVSAPKSAVIQYSLGTMATARTDSPIFVFDMNVEHFTAKYRHWSDYVMFGVGFHCVRTNNIHVPISTDISIGVIERFWQEVIHPDGKIGYHTSHVGPTVTTEQRFACGAYEYGLLKAPDSTMLCKSFYPTIVAPMSMATNIINAITSANAASTPYISDAAWGALSELSRLHRNNKATIDLRHIAQIKE